MGRSAASACSASVAIPKTSTRRAASSDSAFANGPASSRLRSAAAPPINSRPRPLLAGIAGPVGTIVVSTPVPAMASSNPRAPSTAPARHSQRPTR
jgi:hypothetical protein